MLVLSIVFVVLLLVPDMTDVDESLFEFATVTLWALFAAEVVILFGLAPLKRRMLREHWLDIVIVAAPFLRPLRIGRIARVARTGGVLARTLKGVTEVANRRGLQIYGAFALTMICGSALIVYGLEKDLGGSNITNVGDALWWAVVTTTTVGYGDHYPVSGDGRAVAVVLMLVGVGLVGVVTANVAAYFVEHERSDEIAELKSQVDRIEELLVSTRI